MLTKLARLASLLTLFVVAAACAGTAATNVWKKAPQEWWNLVEILTCVQDDEASDPEGHTMFCFGLGCPMAETYQAVIITGLPRVDGLISIESGPHSTVVEMIWDEASTRALNWAVSVASIERQFLVDIQHGTVVRLRSDGAEGLSLSMTNYAAELQELMQSCQMK
jgi:hypothetical protein